MSENWIILIPESPDHIPDVELRKHAAELLRAIAPAAKEIKIVCNDTVQFFDCGENFGSIACPACGADLPLEWWQNTMSHDYSDAGFRLDQYTLPCCDKSSTLHDLRYECPQGFGRFALEAMNPGLDMLDQKHRQELEKILKVPLRVIYQHI